MTRRWRIWWRYSREPRWETALRRCTDKSGGPGATICTRKNPWLRKTDGTDAAVVALTEFMALRCFTFKNQSTTVRGYLSAVKYYHNMFGGRELPMDHHMVVAVGKGIDRAHGRSDVRPKVRKPLITWDMLVRGWEILANRGHEWSVVWMGLALSHHLLCRASEIWAYGTV